MNYEDKKIVGIIATNVEASVALNVIGHLAVAVGKNADEEIMGKRVLTDASGDTHLGISKFPFIITKVKASKLKNAIEEAKKNPKLLVADYPREMLETRTDEELVQAVSLKNKDNIEYMGAVIYGDTEEVNKITGKFQLWRLD